MNFGESAPQRFRNFASEMDEQVALMWLVLRQAFGTKLESLSVNKRFKEIEERLKRFEERVSKLEKELQGGGEFVLRFEDW